MGRPKVDLTGEAFGRLTVIRQNGFLGKSAAWLCACSCGNEVVVRSGALRNPKGTRSCGCLAREVHSVCARAMWTKHGLSRTRVYGIWQSMLARCERPTHKHFSHYGGRGISVCDRWKDFQSFFADMGHPPPGETLDRIDNDGGYEPGNCQWATPIEQACNTSRTLRYQVDGRKVSVKDLAALCGVKEATMRWRLSHWTLERAAPMASAG